MVSYIQVYCKSCKKKVKASIIKKYHQQTYFDEDGPSGGSNQYGLVKILPHHKGLLRQICSTSNTQFKTVIHSSHWNDQT